MCSHYAILKHGKLLKQGAIGDILSSKNQFLLDSNNNEELKSKINQHPSFSTLEDNEGKLKITFNDKVKGSDINEFMHSQGILLSELTELKTSLEDEFLEIIKK
jgi:ABC-2 type transport system ATP-binding protein